jgi:NAD(P)H dehydrogenase (quinone)
MQEEDEGDEQMNISVILAHPGTQSLNHAIASAAVEVLGNNGNKVRFHDLYDEGFDPVLRADEVAKPAALPAEIELHCREIADADGIIIVHPNWWGQPPAILKGWVDRVIRPGVAYEFLEGDEGEGVPRGLLSARSAMVFNTSNTGPNREQAVFGDPLETIWKNCIFGLCGVTDVFRKTFSIVVTSSEDQRAKWLEEVRDAVGRYYPEVK